MTTIVDTSTWGPAVRDARIAGGLTAHELGERADCSHGVLVDLERGNYAPSDALKVRLAAALDAHPHELFPLVPREYVAPWELQGA